VEALPAADEAGRTNVPGLYVVGDLRGVPLLKLSADSGARAVRLAAQEMGGAGPGGNGRRDLVIIGGGVAGMAAALEARELGLDFELLEASEPFSTIVNFPKGKPIYTYPRELEPAGQLKITADVKEDLVDELRRQTVDAGIQPREARAERIARQGGGLEVILADGEEPVKTRAVIAALGRSGNFRRLDVPGEDLDKVYNRLYDPKDHTGQRVLVVGGGDSALETAIALAGCGADVTLSHRRAELSRPKPENVERLQALVDHDTSVSIDVNEPSSERVTTAAGDYLAPAEGRGSVRLLPDSRVAAIRDGEVDLEIGDGSETIPNDTVFAMIGREAPLDFFRRSGANVVGDRGLRFWGTLAAFVAVMTFVYLWKAGGAVTTFFQARGWFPFGSPGEAGGLVGTVVTSFQTPAAWYSLAYTLAIVGFGIRRIRRRRTPYVTVQTVTLMAFQALPLFLLPYVFLPWAGSAGAFGDRLVVEAMAPDALDGWWELSTDAGLSPDARAARAKDAGWLPAATAHWPMLTADVSWAHRRAGDRVILRSAEPGAPTREAILRLSDGRVHARDDTRPGSAWVDALFPASEWDPHGREYWRAFGFILAWPLFLWNVFTHAPLTAWLVISLVQTFVIIPIIVYFWGKGAYCGWVCSCGALAETMGDAHRQKMPHGPVWNRLNMTGQVILALSFMLLGLRVAGWLLPSDHFVNAMFLGGLEGKGTSGAELGFPFGLLNYKVVVDLFLAGIVGVGFYFHFSGRVWCRFACPLAALMHIYARFSRFRILADKKKCISCNVCTSVCHQGIDVMNFANKGAPMQDPQCVRCSACVQSCPTGVLSFGQVDRSGEVISVDRLAASPVRMREGDNASASRAG
jgi:thioredoxin reductase/ferredoxin